MKDANDYLMSGGGRSATFKQVGDWIEGVIAQQPELRQQVDFETKQPKTYRDGNPAMEIRVLLMMAPGTYDEGDEEDDGVRALYVRGDMLRAVREAVRQAKAPGLEVGGKLRVKHYAVGEPKQRGFNGPKLYEAKYRAPEPEPEPPAQLPEEEGRELPAFKPAVVDPDDIPF